MARTMKPMTQEEMQEQIAALQQQMQLKSVAADRNRAQTVSVGKLGCGETEISMRGVDGTYLFNIYHPAEVVELIHQLAANIGCHIMLKPRDDFASWREWKEVTDEDRQHLNGWAPFPQLEQNSQNYGKGLLPKGRPFQKPAKQEVPDGVAADKHENE